MSRIIIENRSSKSDAHVVRMVGNVIENGRISNNEKQYCYVTRFHTGLVISTDLNKASDKFIAYDDTEQP